jgi:asparagine synthase (glutamine-hydrolysing)
MCGISGIISSSKVFHDVLIQAARVDLSHRGPDYFNSVTTCNSLVTLAHNRLSIVDNDPQSNQPFLLGSNVLVFNGEIYNYEILREELAASLGGLSRPQTNSDTEVLATGLLHYGNDFLDRLDGMFAFAWLDKAESTLRLFSDPFGVKQIYYFLDERTGTFVFGSEFEFLCKLVKKLGFDLFVD